MSNPYGAVSHLGGDSANDLDAHLKAEQLEQLVDSVVERIEQRVIDELERRGRRFGQGSF